MTDEIDGTPLNDALAHISKSLHKALAVPKAMLGGENLAHFWSRNLACRYCGWTTLEAQKKQPETGGVGPCPVRKGWWNDGART